MNAEDILGFTFLFWGVTEAVLGAATRAKRRSAQVRDRSSLVILWAVIGTSIFVAEKLKHFELTRMSWPTAWVLSASLVLLLAGLAIRWGAIITLGRFFSSNVAIQQDHQIIRSGLYRVIRHPSYTGALLAFCGLGLSCRNWLSLAVAVVPITAAMLYRIKVEESALLDAFGQEYADYRNSTKRLLPGVY